MSKKLWTFIIEYKGGTYISQFRDVELSEAIASYNETDPSNQGAVPLDNEYTKIKDLESVFCLSGVSLERNSNRLKKSNVIFGNAVLTAEV